MSAAASRIALQAVAGGTVVIGLLADVAQLALDPPASVVDLFPWGLAAVLLPVVALLVGMLLALRRPRLSLGWLLLAIGLAVPFEGAVGALGTVLLPIVPETATWMRWFGGEDQWAWIPPIGLLFTQVPLRFPDGRLPSPRWRWFSRYTLVAIVVACAAFATVEPTVAPGVPNPTFGGWGDVGALVAIVPGLLIAVAFIGSISSLIVRYRRADVTMRAQLRWIFWAAAVVAGLLILSWFGDPAAPGFAGVLDLVLSSAAALAYSLVPLAILLAVMRYGLYSIDRIVSRTTTYTIVTLTVVGVYLLVVLLASLLLPKLESVGVAVATLAAAAAFLPVLRVVRRTIDRVFDRSQYDAERVVAAFGERIRTGADPHTAGDDLSMAVQRTLQPGSMGIWTRP